MRRKVVAALLFLGRNIDCDSFNTALRFAVMKIGTFTMKPMMNKVTWNAKNPIMIHCCVSADASRKVKPMV